MSIRVSPKKGSWPVRMGNEAVGEGSGEPETSDPSGMSHWPTDEASDVRRERPGRSWVSALNNPVKEANIPLCVSSLGLGASSESPSASLTARLSMLARRLPMLLEILRRLSILFLRPSRRHRGLSRWKLDTELGTRAAWGPPNTAPSSSSSPYAEPTWESRRRREVA